MKTLMALQRTLRYLSHFEAMAFFLVLVLASQTAFSQNHPQEKIFGNETAVIDVGINPKAEVRVINPLFYGENFGFVQLPNLQQLVQDPQQTKNLVDIFGMGTAFSERKRSAFVPPETGRGLLLEPSSQKTYRDILVKGTGPVDKFTVNNQLRFESLGFDGFFEVSEAVRDLVTSEILHSAGVLVSRGLTVIDHNLLVERKGLPQPLRMGNYVRAYRVQTRLSNLEKLSVESRKAAIDDAIERIHELNGVKLNYVQYFQYMVTAMAKNVAIYQAIGFTQDSLHFGQVTLAGEMTDLGIGTFERPKEKGVVNTKYPWFRFERQPVLMQNMLYRTHSVKAEPEPVLLAADSKTVESQKTLFEYIRSFSPESAAAIEGMNPLRMFWESYEQFYRQYNAPQFYKDVLSRLNDFYEWKYEDSLKRLPSGVQENVRTEYLKKIKEWSQGIDRPGRYGPMAITSIEKKLLFYRAAKKFNVSGFLNMSELLAANWPIQGKVGKYLNYGFKNPVADLSWKPANMTDFHEAKVGPHPLQGLLRKSAEPVSVGQKIIWVTPNGVSPFAVIKSIKNNIYEISYEEPGTQQIKTVMGDRETVMKFNDPEKIVKMGNIVSGTKIDLGPNHKNRVSRLLKEVDASKPDFNRDTEDEILSKQKSALYEVVRFALSDYYEDLPPAEQKEYMYGLRSRIDGIKILGLEEAMVKGCGNCMDQNLLTNLLLSKIADKYNFRYGAYIAKDPARGDKHFYTIVTLLPSQAQYVIESSAGGNRVFNLNQVYAKSWFPIQNILDRHGPKTTTLKCERLFLNK